MSSVVFTGTATNHYDLLNKIVTHLTSGAMGSQAWTLLKSEFLQPNDTEYRYLRAPGLSGTDNIYINLAVNQQPGPDIFTLHIRGAIAFNNLLTWGVQPGTSPTSIVPLWDSTIPYWLIANGRRFIIIAKVSTTYQSGYAGFFIPYGTSSEMPYPIVVMGNSGSSNRWSTADYRTGGFFDPVNGSSRFRFFDGAWVEIANYENRADIRQDFTTTTIWPFSYNFGIGMQRDGSYALYPTILHSAYSAPNVLGELEGVFQVSGFSNASEDIITIGADQYLVVQSVYRTSNRDYAAIKLG